MFLKTFNAPGKFVREQIKLENCGVKFKDGKLVSSTGLSGTDKTLGLVFGVFRGFLIILAIVIILPELVPVSSDQWWTESKLIPFFQSFESVGQEIATLIINKITIVFYYFSIEGKMPQG